jgi:uncharacterized protein (TIGR03435 family)
MAARLIMRLALAAVVTTTPQVLVAQEMPSFAAASVKANPSGLHPSGLPGGTTDFRPGGRFSFVNVALLELIGTAYSIENYRIVGGPDWLRSARFNIEATAGADVPIEQARLMLRALLAERFNLRARLEPRDMPTYTLVVGRSDGRLGPALRPASPAACVTRRAGAAPAGELPTCGQLRSGPDRMSGRRVAIAELSSRISRIAGRVVIDQTGLTGAYDIDLEWTPGEAARAAVDALTPGAPPAPVDPNRPALITAVQEQLGLRLQPTRGPVDVLAIDGAEFPTEN